MKKYKPNPKYKILTAKWYNPVFWIMFILATLLCMCISAWEELKESYNSIKSWDLK